MGVWASQIPRIKASLSLSDSALAAVVLCFAVGAIVTMPLTGALATRLGGVRTVLAMGVAGAAGLALLGLAAGYSTLLGAALFAGMALGGLDVAMNTQATAVERAWDRPIMSGIHGWFSLGGLAGAAAGGALTGASLSIRTVLLIAAAVDLLATLGPARWLAVPGTHAASAPGFAWPRRAVLGIGLLCLLAFLIEGAVFDWTAVYMHEVAGASLGFASAGFGGFSLTMAATRFVGVVVPWHICCGDCEQCRAGLTASCLEARSACFGLPLGGHWGGLFSDLVRVPYADAMLVKLPYGLDPVLVASAGDNLTDAWISVRKGLARHPGGRVLVVGGTGSLPLYAVSHALALDAHSVDYVDQDEARRAVAKTLGATVHEHIAPDFTMQFHVVVSGTRDPAELKLAIQSAKPGGHVSGLAIYFQDIPMPLWEMYLRDVSFSTGRPSVRPHIPDVLEMVRGGKTHPEHVTSRIIAWDDAADALVEPSLKPIVVRPRAFAAGK